MPAQQALRAFSPARVVLGFAAAVLVGLVCWVAVRAVGPAQAAHRPTVVVPPSSPTGAGPAALTPLGANLSTIPPAVSAAPVSAQPSVTTSSPAPSTTPSAPRRAFTATVTVGTTWDSGYLALVRVVNTGSRPLAWTVTVAHSGLDDLRLRGVWNATGRQSGTSVVLTGAPLAPGATIDAGYQIAKRGRGDAQPSGCTIVGGSCGVR